MSELRAFLGDLGDVVAEGSIRPSETAQLLKVLSTGGEDEFEELAQLVGQMAEQGERVPGLAETLSALAAGAVEEESVEEEPAAESEPLSPSGEAQGAEGTVAGLPPSGTGDGATAPASTGVQQPE